MFLFCLKFKPIHPRVPNLVEIGRGSGEVFYIHLCIFEKNNYYLPFERDVFLHLEKLLESPSPKNNLGQIWKNVTQRFFRKRFWNFVVEFSQCRFYLSLEKGVSLHWNNLNPLYTRMLCWFLSPHDGHRPKFGWNWFNGSAEEVEQFTDRRA